jgi:nucleotide-binding universal stress UspA family protein
MTQTDHTPPADLEPNEALYWAATDAFLQRRGDEPTAEELDALINETIERFVPGCDQPQRDFHKAEALRFIMGAVASSGMARELPGDVLVWNTDKDNPEALRPLRAVTGALATVMIASTPEELAAIEHLALPLAERQAIETTLQQHFGTSKDVVSACRFPFQAVDFQRLQVDDLLTKNLVAGAEGSDEEFDQAFRQALLRRSPVSRVWKLPDGHYGFVALWPVTVISMLASDYWQHGTAHSEAPSQRLSEILAGALAQRELLGTRVDLYCGHLHVGPEIVEAAAAIEADLMAAGAKPHKMPVRRASARVGRNLPCPCGSGVKYKKCCGAT